MRRPAFASAAAPDELEAEEMAGDADEEQGDDQEHDGERLEEAFAVDELSLIHI